METIVLTAYETTRLSNLPQGPYRGARVLTAYETTRLSNKLPGR